MFEPIVEVGKWFTSLVPTDFRSFDPRKWKFNFLAIHYCYMIGMTIITSIILYGDSYIPYIDAIFFGAGSATQSGLNTMNINDMLLYQQVTMMLIACVTNPIFINTMVVFVRLYWFEKRFEHIVKEIRKNRDNRPTTIPRRTIHASDVPDLEQGVQKEEIRVLHETTQPNGMSGTTARTKEEEDKFKEKLMGLETNADSVEPTPEGSSKSSDGTAAADNEDHVATDTIEKDEERIDAAPVTPAAEHHLGLNPKISREITFADEVKTPGDPNQTHELAKIPEQQDFSKHFEFIQRQQRNAKDGTALRIPGPRGFDRGEKPEHLDEDSDEDELNRPQTRNTLTPIRSESDRDGRNTRGEEELNGDDHPARGGIKFDEPEHPGHRTMDRTNTANSQSVPSRIKSNLQNQLRHRRSNSRRLNLSQAGGSIGRTFSTIQSALSQEKNQDPMPYLSYQATTGRNSAFLGLTEEQREELGGIEYRALKTLAKVLILYFIGFHLSGLIANLPWIMYVQYWKNKVIADGIDPAWWGIFTAASEFNDLGFTLTPDSMNSFQEATWPLLYGSFLIIIGNTGFPIMLRFVIWVTHLLAPRGSALWEELRFLLDHPRRCFTLLFPSKATWWLFWVLVLLNGIDLIFFIILDLHDPVVTDVPGGYRVLDGWFQATSTRTAGFSCVNLFYLHPGIQVSYMIMMYISVFPVAISVRRTNVYEEKSLGIFGGEEEGGNEDPSYVSQHLRRQLSFDLWYIFLGLFIICIVEGDRIQNTNDYAFTLFSVLFEIVSAYGTVGLSLGYPNTDPSFSAQFRVISKLVIIAMMLRGRHRGLPYALDRAILLPSEKMQRAETEEAERRARRGSLFAEYEADRRQGSAWSPELDESGLPRQHLGHASSQHDMAMSAGAGGERPTLENPHNRLRRRGSAVSTASQRPRHERSRSLSRILAGGLSAGPTLSKHE